MSMVVLVQRAAVDVCLEVVRVAWSDEIDPLCHVLYPFWEELNRFDFASSLLSFGTCLWFL